MTSRDVKGFRQLHSTFQADLKIACYSIRLNVNNNLLAGYQN